MELTESELAQIEEADEIGIRLEMIAGAAVLGVLTELPSSEADF